MKKTIAILCAILIMSLAATARADYRYHWPNAVMEKISLSGSTGVMLYNSSGTLYVRNGANSAYADVLANEFNSAGSVLRTNGDSLSLIADNDGGGTGAIYLKTDGSTTAGLLQEGGDLSLYGAAGDTPGIYFDVAADADVTLLEVEDSSGNGTLTWNSSQDRFDFSDKAYFPYFISGAALSNYSYDSSTTVNMFSSGCASQVTTNLGSTAAVQFNLPAVSQGLAVTITVAAGQTVTINPDDADQILGWTDAAGDAIQSSTIGAAVRLIGLDTTNWACFAYDAPGTGDAWADVD